jgi:hypothetical protein
MANLSAAAAILRGLAALSGWRLRIPVLPDAVEAGWK